MSLDDKVTTHMLLSLLFYLYGNKLDGSLIPMHKVKEDKSYLSDDINYLIKTVLSDNPVIEFYKCASCQRNLPKHVLFFSKNSKNAFNGFWNHTCKECRGSYFLDKENLSNEKVLQFYQRILDGHKKAVFNGFWRNKDNQKVIIRHLLQDINENEIYKLTQKFFVENKIKYGDSFSSSHEAFIYSFPEYKLYPWKFTGRTKNYWHEKENIDYALNCFIEHLLESKITDNIEQIPSMKISWGDTFKDFGLSTLFFNYFNGSSYQIFNYIFPNKWKEYAFQQTTKDYFNSEEVCRKVIIEVFFHNVYPKREELLNLKVRMFFTNNVYSLILRYGSNVAKCIISCFPEYNFKEWEFADVPNGYWNDKETRIVALKDLIEDTLKLSKEKIPLIFTKAFLSKNHQNFIGALTVHYDSCLYDWINEVYPNVYTIDQFEDNICSDGTIVENNEELTIHNYFINTFPTSDVRYTGKSKKRKFGFYNSINEEWYYPDWQNNDKTIVIEYFGMFNEKSKDGFVKEYTEKAKRKTKYFSSLSNVLFITLYPQDFKNNMMGIKEKLNVFE